MGAIASQITSLTIVYWTVYSDADQRKHQSSASLAFVWGIHRGRWIPRTKGQLRGKCFHLMTSSWTKYGTSGSCRRMAIIGTTIMVPYPVIMKSSINKSSKMGEEEEMMDFALAQELTWFPQVQIVVSCFLLRSWCHQSMWRYSIRVLGDSVRKNMQMRDICHSLFKLQGAWNV